MEPTTTRFDIDGGAASTINLDLDREDRETPRWLFFAGDFPDTVGDVQPAGGVDFGSLCIVPPAGKLGFMNRCLATPMVVTWHQYNRKEVPEGMRIREPLPGKDVLGRPTDMVHIAISPGPEFHSLMRGYASWGLREIEALRGKAPEEVVQLRVNTFFFPEWPKLPRTNAEVIQYIDSRRDFFLKAEKRDLYMKIADEMIEAVKQTDRWMRGHVDEVHSNFLRPVGDPKRKTNYDRVDLLFIDRANLQRRDQDQITMVETQANIAKMLSTMQQPAAQPAMTAEDFLKTMQVMLGQNADIVKAALATAGASATSPGKITQEPEKPEKPEKK